MNLVLLNNLLKLIGIDALSFIITEYHLTFHHLLILWVLFLKELLNTIAIDMELLLIAEFSLSEVFIA
jgi:hypothetical protein